MDIILEKDYPQLGFVGDRIQVKRGYGRNYLIPQGIAVEINSRNEKFLKNKLAAITAQRNKLKADAEALSQKMTSEEWNFTLKVGSKGKSFGSFSAKNIHEELVARGYQVAKNQVVLADVVKGAGEFKFQVKLHSEVNPRVTFKVNAEKVAGKNEKGEDSKDDSAEAAE